MDSDDFKHKVLSMNPEIDLAKFGVIFSFIDFGNVNHWFDKEAELKIDLNKLKKFTKTFFKSSWIYYGFDPLNKKSINFINWMKVFFGKYYVYSKNIQKIIHQPNSAVIHKCNFDVEITVDAIRLADNYKTLCLFSGDADFLRLVRYLKQEKNKKIILIKGGFIQRELAKTVDLLIDAEDIKNLITNKNSKI